jgi:hypothetical protein
MRRGTLQVACLTWQRLDELTTHFRRIIRANRNRVEFDGVTFCL